jgi:hypothetical protein
MAVDIRPTPTLSRHRAGNRRRQPRPASHGQLTYADFLIAAARRTILFLQRGRDAGGGDLRARLIAPEGGLVSRGNALSRRVGQRGSAFSCDHLLRHLRTPPHSRRMAADGR